LKFRIRRERSEKFERDLLIITCKRQCFIRIIIQNYFSDLNIFFPSGLTSNLKGNDEK